MNQYSTGMGTQWPSSTQLTEALLRVLARIGGAGSVTDLDAEIINEVKLSEDLIQIKHSGNRTEIESSC